MKTITNFIIALLFFASCGSNSHESLTPIGDPRFSNLNLDTNDSQIRPENKAQKGIFINSDTQGDIEDALSLYDDVLNFLEKAHPVKSETAHDTIMLTHDTTVSTYTIVTYVFHMKKFQLT